VFLTAGTVNTWLDYCNSLSVPSSMDGPRSARMISGQLSLLSSVGQDTSQTAVMLWGWGVGAGWFVALADKRVGGRRNWCVIRRKHVPYWALRDESITQCSTNALFTYLLGKTSVSCHKNWCLATSDERRVSKCYTIIHHTHRESNDCS